ncbi:MAG: DJ-1/PfpI family protein [Spirochaetales bacterium]|nr:DJ-1/PfpI family protein [Leptospiraceae bacterium]MCP5480301.1 DJ-1/PfpI family protein [Spirochaetales bacterium]MCP5486937.1 DJ-1/PfpI family protein [Spirochaetales bacterium]
MSKGGLAVGIYVFEGVEVLDFAGPFEVLSVTRLEPERRRESESPFRVSLISRTGQPVRATGGLIVTPNASIENHSPLDILIVPGGYGTRREHLRANVQDWIREERRRVQLLASVCTGAFLLAAAGALEGLPATTHHAAFDELLRLYPNTVLDSQKRFILHDRVATSGGISAGIDLSLKVVERFYGLEVARATARHMEYPFPEHDVVPGAR